MVYSTEQINRTVSELGKLDQEAVRLQNHGLTEDSKEVKQLSKSLDSQIDALSEMIRALRSGYCKYLK